MLSVGDKLPEFSLTATVSREKGKEFKTITSKDYAGKWIVLFFYPKDFTFVCPTEITEFAKQNREFNDRDAMVIGGSTDNEFSHLAWRNQHADLADIPFPLVHLTPAYGEALGVINKQAGVANRATFIIDPEGTIRFATATDLSVGRNVPDVLRTLDALQTGELCPCNWEKGQSTL